MVRFLFAAGLALCATAQGATHSLAYEAGSDSLRVLADGTATAASLPDYGRGVQAGSLSADPRADRVYFAINDGATQTLHTLGYGAIGSAAQAALPSALRLTHAEWDGQGNRLVGLALAGAESVPHLVAYQDGSLADLGPALGQDVVFRTAVSAFRPDDASLFLVGRIEGELQDRLFRFVLQTTPTVESLPIDSDLSVQELVVDAGGQVYGLAWSASAALTRLIAVDASLVIVPRGAGVAGCCFALAGPVAIDPGTNALLVLGKDVASASPSPQHAWRFDLASGAAIDGGSTDPAVGLWYDAGVGDNTYAITVAVVPPGIGSAVCSPNPVLHNTDSICTAAAVQAGYHFTEWSGDCTGASCMLSAVTGTRSVVAQFALNTYAVAAASDPPGAATVTCTPNPVDHGAAASCSYADVQPGYQFTGWSGDCTGASCVLNDVTGTRSVVAQFALNTYAIAAASDPPGAATVTCTPNPVDHGAAASCSYADVQPGHQFTGWSGDCTGTSCVLGAVTGTRSVVAQFAPVAIPTDLSVSIDNQRQLSAPGDLVIYTIEVRNDGVGPVQGLELRTLASPVGVLLEPAWECRIAAPGSCTPGAGLGAVNLSLNLPAQSQGRIELSARLGPFQNAFAVSAALVVPMDYADADSGDDVATDIDLAADGGIFHDGFGESLGAGSAIFSDDFEEGVP